MVPSTARAMLNIRLLPGNLLDPLLGKLTQLVNDPQVRFEPQTSIGQSAPSSPVDSDFFAEITLTAAKEFPGATVVPMMSTGATDSQQLRLRSVKAYGLLPFPLPEADILRMHADDERLLSIQFRKGVAFLSHSHWLRGFPVVVGEGLFTPEATCGGRRTALPQFGPLVVRATYPSPTKAA